MTDNVNHPAHYEANGPFECIELAQHYDFCLGNAIKYVWRHMDKGHSVEDLSKALWYIQREIDTTDSDYSPAPTGAARKLFTLSDMDYAHMADFWYALFDGNLTDAKQEIQTRIEKLTANYRLRALGGPDIAANLVACCQDCNLGKSSINPDEPLVADVSQQAEAFRKAMEAAKKDVMADIARETKYVHAVQRLWENCTSLDDEYCLPLPDTWPSSARYWAQIGAPEELIEYAFLVTKERYDNHRIPARNAFAYASGIIGNLMEEAARTAQKRSE